MADSYGRMPSRARRAQNNHHSASSSTGAHPVKAHYIKKKRGKNKDRMSSLEAWDSHCSRSTPSMNSAHSCEQCYGVVGVLVDHVGYHE
jgi:hypothetical protein